MTDTSEQLKRFMARNLPLFDAPHPCLIGRVKDEFGAFSNMSDHTVTFEDNVWPRAEQLFQALRFPEGHDLRVSLLAERNPMRAKMSVKPRLSESTVEPRSWADIANMKTIIRLKCEQHPSVRALLLSTGERVIVEDCSRRQSDSGLFWGARFLGGEQWEGHDWLGALWMGLRREIMLTG